MTTVEHTARQTGPITLHIDTQAADVQVVADPRVTGTIFELSTPDTDGAAVDAIRTARFRDDGADVYLTVRSEGTTINGPVQFGNGNVQINGMTMTNGRIVVNGMVVNGTNFGSGPITVRAITEPGSAVDVKTMSGDVVTKNVAAVRARTMSGEIRAEGLSADSALKSMSGDIRVSGTGDGAAPLVTATTMSGDVYGVGVDLAGKSMSGRVWQRRASAVDEW
ncbi:DUF4097 family beta strand repeat-containing protein [Actinoplanes sp. NPDC026619]|uniref:DUF4097 family beta strand repeat-containing protein n=1 Tax=Actinoplanes sp. NPDC026619 TaxID=3155798 RepID=UPI0033E087EC